MGIPTYGKVIHIKVINIRTLLNKKNRSNLNGIFICIFVFISNF